MIAHLAGHILKKASDHLIIDVNGVGYQVFIALPVLESLSEGSEISIHIYTQVTENSICLYGFLLESESLLFNSLISINGIGPKMAITILSHPPEQISKALISEDISYLIQIPGVGKKMAERMVLELKNKITLSETATGVILFSVTP